MLKKLFLKEKSRSVPILCHVHVWVGQVFKCGGFGCRRWLNVLSSSSAPWFSAPTRCPTAERTCLVSRLIYGLGVFNVLLPNFSQTQHHRITPRSKTPSEFFTKHQPKIVLYYDTCVNSVWNHHLCMLAYQFWDFRKPLGLYWVLNVRQGLLTF